VKYEHRPPGSQLCCPSFLSFTFPIFGESFGSKQWLFFEQTGAFSVPRALIRYNYRRLWHVRLLKYLAVNMSHAHPTVLSDNCLGPAAEPRRRRRHPRPPQCHFLMLSTRPRAAAEAEKTPEGDVPRAQTTTTSRSRKTEEQEVGLHMPGSFDFGDEAVVPRVKRRVRVPSVCSKVSVRSGTCSGGCK